ncbi:MULTISPECIES: PilZ domain-containing protein [unclassified Butyrivibrio]|uniref:PilZ domain-containing protein n=1 Tax=unclassified Butyrivibrio TaxID=2639466 RepID=UPI0003B48735|nr:MULTISPECIES: PilZ domain-containing protein [unclassified Butyrivibrio]MDC7292292.1 PilZ domain-containing protein [Butyrivibrio sp. DSM 10294]
MEERRKINRIEFKADSVIVDRDSLEKIYGQVKNISPLGMAITVKEDAPSMIGKDVIIVAETLIMYADVVREDKEEDGTRTLAFNAKRFSQDVLQYLFEHIALD